MRGSTVLDTFTRSMAMLQPATHLVAQFDSHLLGDAGSHTHGRHPARLRAANHLPILGVALGRTQTHIHTQAQAHVCTHTHRQITSYLERQSHDSHTYSFVEILRDLSGLPWSSLPLNNQDLHSVRIGNLRKRPCGPCGVLTGHGYGMLQAMYCIYSITCFMIFETRLINETRLLFECNKVLLI